ncbi:SDR family oxidoreductase [Paracoccus sp. 1_MG-2023]|uniref:SDR family NAD(P)-dependent oxidoreductase n=1 Tax=unclassified Paracoccus (in: a-proteobacteria) TaxID=2688777 RepID=UPI001C094638|nr:MULTISPECIES: SDR family oxidoreductase [unclassified Paracoccus (in: a-proteobacteria)]MBU2957881.1 SDR family oxidoreductase [Paracoccus sp. C2R09]MDO6668926.1 SDR family oxidoreductase [Paracoccus sp. 1_MG-2023]
MTATLSVEGRIACVTGASSGLGRTIAQSLVRGGARVVSVARRKADWCDGTRSRAISADLSDLQGVPDIAAEVADVFGPPDILVNAAGINTRQPADEVTLDGWLTTLDLNLSVPFFLAQAMVPGMRDRGWGRILNFASLQSGRAFHGGIAYGASKGGIAQLTRAMAEAWSRDGIMANALAPGFFPTELTGPVFGDADLAARNAAQTCIGRNGRLDDITGPAMFLCSDASEYVTGQILYVDGGFTAK